MPAPSAYPDWDVNGTLTTPTTSGHALGGWSHGEVVPADEMNYWMMFVGLWIRYLAALASASTYRWTIASAGRLRGGATIDLTTSGVKASAPSDGVDLI